MIRTAIGAALLSVGILLSAPALAAQAPRTAPALRAPALPRPALQRPALPRPAIRPARLPHAAKFHHKRHHARRHRLPRIIAVVERRPFALRYPAPQVIYVEAEPEANGPAVAQAERKAGCELEEVPVAGTTITVIRC
jgi:hypothetical protein